MKQLSFYQDNQRGRSRWSVSHSVLIYLFFVTAYICIINLMKHHCAVRPYVGKPKFFF